MRLMEAILDANRRAVAGDKSAGLHPAEFTASLPLVAMTCIDARLNKLLPGVLGVPDDQFIWLRNAGNIITGPLSSTMRSLALGCLVKGGREIAVIGHTDCLVGKSTMLKLTDAMKALGVERTRLPENLIEYFGMFASERQNVLKAVEVIRASPLIGPKVPVHGLMLDIESGKLEWLVNGYQALDTASSQFSSVIRKAETIGTALEDMPQFKLGNMEFPTAKIGEAASQTADFLQRVETKVERAEEAIGKVADRLHHHHPQRDSATAPLEKPAESQSVAERIGERISEYAEQKLGEVAAAASPAEALKRKININRRYILIGSDQKRYGPISGRVVLQWIGDNRIDASTPVQVEGADVWQTLGSMPDQQATPPLPPPLSSGRPFRGRR